MVEVGTAWLKCWALVWLLQDGWMLALAGQMLKLGLNLTFVFFWFVYL
jgi:hypothetical protein